MQGKLSVTIILVLIAVGIFLLFNVIGWITIDA